MEEENTIIPIEEKDIEGTPIQVFVYPFHCNQQSADKTITMKVHNPGTITLSKLSSGKRCLAVYGVVPENANDKSDLLPYFKECLDRISRVKNLKSILFFESILVGEGYITALRSFSEETEALVYLCECKKEKHIHRSFGDLIGQISRWKKQRCGWDIFFQARIADKTISKLNAFLQKEAEEYFIYPPPEEIFNAMMLAKLSDVKVIIIGQDPYHTPGAAMGLAFGHKATYGKIQPSLRKIYEELKNCGYKTNKTGDLTKWAKQGVFLINTALTVRQGQASSHMKEWEPFTQHLFTFLNKHINHAVIVMWGAPAQSYSKLFDDKKHKKIMTSHPCPMSAHISFIGSKPFIKCNEYLKEWGIKEIDWNL